LALCAMVAFGIPAGFIIFWSVYLHRWGNLSEHLGRAALAIAGGVALLLALGITSAIITVFTKDFVVPQMALENASIRLGWERVLAAMRAEPKRWAGYVGLKILLALAAGMLMGIVWIGFVL